MRNGLLCSAVGLKLEEIESHAPFLEKTLTKVFLFFLFGATMRGDH